MTIWNKKVNRQESMALRSQQRSSDNIWNKLEVKWIVLFCHNILYLNHAYEVVKVYQDTNIYKNVQCFLKYVCRYFFLAALSFLGRSYLWRSTDSSVFQLLLLSSLGGSSAFLLTSYLDKLSSTNPIFSYTTRRKEQNSPQPFQAN